MAVVDMVARMVVRYLVMCAQMVVCQVYQIAVGITVTTHVEMRVAFYVFLAVMVVLVAIRHVKDRVILIAPVDVGVVQIHVVLPVEAHVRVHVLAVVAVVVVVLPVVVVVLMVAKAVLVLVMEFVVTFV